MSRTRSHGRVEAAVEERPHGDDLLLPRILFFERSGGDLLENLLLQPLHDLGEQVLLVAELVVQRAAGNARRLHDLLGGHAGVAALAEQAPGRLDQGVAGRLGLLGLAILDIHTVCMLDTGCTYGNRRFQRNDG